MELESFESIDQYFIEEASELLQTIEQELLNILEEKTTDKVHLLMRSAHTIKGSAANCGLKTIETIAHHLEDVFQALYPPELEIDSTLGSLLMEGYDCLRSALTPTLSNLPYDEEEVLDRTATVFAQLQTQLGDFFGREAPLPTSEELGFDVVGLMFSDSIPQDLQQLEATIASENIDEVQTLLNSQAGFFKEIGLSYELPGLVEIGEAIFTAIEQHPEQILSIAQAALENFQQACDSVLEGDRTQGGVVSDRLGHWTNTSVSTKTNSFLDYISDSSSEQDWLVEEEEENSSSDSDSNLTEELSTMIDDLVIETPAVSLKAETLLPQEEATLVMENSSSDSESNLTGELLTMVDDFATETSTVSPEPKTSVSQEEATAVAETSSPDLDSNLTEEVSTMIDDSIIETSTVSPEPETLVSQEEATLIAEKSSPDSSSLTHLIKEPITNDSATATSPIDRILQSIFKGGWKNDIIKSPTTPAQTKNNSPSKIRSPETGATVRVAVKQLDRLSHTIGELLISENQQHLQSDQINSLTQNAIEQFLLCQQQISQIRDWSDQNLLLPESKRKENHNLKTSTKSSVIQNSLTDIQSEFDVLEMDVYSGLHLLLQNLAEKMMKLGEQIESLEGFAQNLRFNVGKRKQLLSGAQEDLLQARMIPVATVLNRFPRLVQQMVAANQKPAELKLVGTQVLIDKVIVEKLYDPLLHLIRNAYDHGLESAGVRRQQGKSETGQITVEAYHQGNRSYIKISDDGKGLDWKRIRVKAVEKNLLTQQEADSLPEAQLAEVLFEPGFSTKEKVSQLSGRGIGLDVVRSQLQAVQGSISVHSELGKSTTFVLQFPLSLTTARLLICQSQGIVYALISEVIDQVVLPQPEQIKHQQSKIGKHQQSFLCWGDKSDQELIPIHPLTNLINYQHPSSFNGENTSLGIFPLKPRNSVNPLLMLKHQKQRLCLEVEQILVEQELVIKSLGNNLTLPNYIQGYSVLGDGSLTLVIEPEVLISQIEKNTLQTNWGNLCASSSSFKILNRFEEEQPQDSVMQSNNQNTNTEQNSSLRKSIKILVVDDSIVQRQTLIANLTSANYQVLQAGNGQEALAQLNKHSDIQLIICDIEMPHMNGFEFLSHWRQDSRFPEIPVMMLTTRSGEKHRHLALALGAKAYFTKPHSQPELLEQITKILGQSNFELRTQNLELSKP